MKKIIIFILLSILFVGCGNTSSVTNSKTQKSQLPITETEFILNTIASISVYEANNSKDVVQIINECFSLCSDYEKLFSRTIEGSDVDKINKSNGTAVEVSPETTELINLSLKYSNLSQGAFDITIEPISALWNFQSETPVVPPSELINEVVKHVDYKNIVVEGNTVKLKDPIASIDLGGIAKGYIADRAADFLKENGVTSAIINLGGNILTIGTKTDGDKFSIGIQKPFDEQNSVLGIIYSDDMSIVTSGVYERYFKINNVIYHHILNPKTGYPIENNIFSVTIVSKTSADCDALSTACFVLGLEKGMALIESLDGIEAVFVTNDYKTHSSSGIGNTIEFKLK